MNSEPAVPEARPTLSVVVPTYREAANVPVLFERLKSALAGLPWEMIVVDDDSSDGTADVAFALAAHDPRLRCLRRVNRVGLAGAVIEGWLASSADLVAVIDGDLQHDETILPKMYAALFSSDVERLWCDHPTTHERLAQFVQQYMPRLRSRVSLYEGQEPIFDHFGIEPQLDRALERKVWLKSGGYLVFDQAEALTAIDVNTGRFVGKKNQEETVLKTNLEAVDEVANQLRLRNIGGIIIVDFIDMTKEGNRKRVSEALGQALRRDKARTSMFKISELGLVQMTRKRTRDSLQAMLTDQCPKCEGRAVIKSIPTLAAEILRGIQRDASRRNHGGMLLVKVNPDMARYLYGPGFKGLEELEQRFEVKVVLKSKEGLETGAFEITQAPAAA